MQAEIIQWEKSVQAECILYIDDIRQCIVYISSLQSECQHPLGGADNKLGS